MKDRQAPQTHAQVRIPLISAVLHCISMSVVVFLRSGFGYGFLRPKSIFLAFAWAIILFSVYAWLEPGQWSKYGTTCTFFIASALLYTYHLTASFLSELHGSATHDNDSGVPHILRILNPKSADQFRAKWVLWAEPALVLAASIAAGWPIGAKHLSAWLFLSAVSLWLKEALNFWLQIRQKKRHRDAMEDAEDGLDGSHAQPDFVAPAQSRRDKVRRNRAP